MKIYCGVPGSEKLPPAYRRAVNIRHELSRAVGLYGIGDRLPAVLRTLAEGKAAYSAIGLNVTRPTQINREDWDRILKDLVQRFNVKPFGDPNAESCSGEQNNKSQTAA